MNYSKELKIGIFVIVVLVASFFLINYLRGEDIMNREIELVSRYENVEGLVASAPVFIKGFKAGKVTEVVYDPETDDFRVTCSIKKEFRIPVDSRMTIYAVDIMGGKGIKLELGSSQTMVKDGGSLQSEFEPGLMDGLAAEISPLLSKVRTTLDSLALTVEGMNRVLSRENTEAISRTIVNLENTMANVRKLASTVEGKSDDLDAFIANLADLSGKFNGIGSKLDTTATEVNSLIQTLNESDIEGVVDSFKSLLVKINDPDGTIGKLIVDDSIHDSVDSLLNDIDELVRKIQKNPKKYIKISVF